MREHIWISVLCVYIYIYTRIIISTTQSRRAQPAYFIEASALCGLLPWFESSQPKKAKLPISLNKVLVEGA